MFVYPERMLANLNSTRGLVFSGQLLLDLVEKGMSREEAYRQVQKQAMRSWKEGLDFRDLILNDDEITARIPRHQLEKSFDVQRQLRNIDGIFARVFPGKNRAESKQTRARKDGRRKRKKV
jgi:adenylosuccinate lyase